MKKYSLILILIISLTICSVFPSCYTYYKSTIHTSQEDIINALKFHATPNRSLILRLENENFLLSKFMFDQEQNRFTFAIHPLKPAQTLHVSNNNSQMKYDPKDSSSNVIHEIHIFSSQPLQQLHEDVFAINKFQIYKIEVLDHDTDKTKKSKRVGAIITLSVIGGLILGIRAAGFPFSMSF